MALVSVRTAFLLVIFAHVHQVLVVINVRPIIGLVKLILAGTMVFHYFILIIEVKKEIISL
jgi:hypothetical protein